MGYMQPRFFATKGHVPPPLLLFKKNEGKKHPEVQVLAGLAGPVAKDNLALGGSCGKSYCGWTKSISHQVETGGNEGLLVFYRGIRSQWIMSIHTIDPPGDKPQAETERDLSWACHPQLFGVESHGACRTAGFLAEKICFDQLYGCGSKIG